MEVLITYLLQSRYYARLSGGLAGRIIEATLRRAWLVLRWVTFCGNTVLNTRANSAFYPQQDGKWIPAKDQWQCSATGKVTVDLASHRPCVTDTDSVLYQPTGSVA